MAAVGPATPVPDAAAIRQLERELRDLGQRNALGQLPDAAYFEQRGRFLAELDEARSPRAAAETRITLRPVPAAVLANLPGTRRTPALRNGT